MRATFVTSGLDTGGAEHALLRLLTKLRAHGVESAVVSLRTEGDVGPNMAAHGIPVEALGLPRNVLTALPSLLLHVRRWQPDLIHGWMYHGNVAATVAAKLARRNAPLLWGIRQSLGCGNRDRWLTRRVISASARLSSGASLIVYNSSAARAQHASHGFADKRAVVVPNGLETDLFRPDDDARRAVRSALGVGDDDLVVGHVARFHPSKDHGTFLRAAAAVRQGLPQCVFALAGKDVDGSNRELMRSIEALSLGRHVRLLGRRTDMPGLMAAFDVACLTSSGMEAFPNVIAEAMSCGVPCVSTGVGDAAEIIGDTGAVVPVGDHHALSTAVLSLLSLDTEARRARGAAARERIVRNFGIGQVARRYADLLASAVASSRSTH